MRLEENTTNIIATFKKHQRFLITTHGNPDPDALCSELILMLYLQSLGKKVWIVNEEEVPQRYRWIPYASRIKRYDEAISCIYDVGITLDCGQLDRIGKVQRVLKKSCLLVNIDHHTTNTYFADLNLVLPSASSTAEIIFDLVKSQHYSLTKRSAALLYMGIMTDTGSFRYQNTSAKTHRIVAELLPFGFSVDEIYHRFYEVISPKDFKLFVEFLQKYKRVFDNQVVYIQFSKKKEQQFSNTFDLRSTTFQFLRLISEVKVIIIFTELDRAKTRVNFRSIPDFDVAKVATYFQGGGHRQASGCTILKPMAEAKREVLHCLRKYFKA